MVLAYLFWHRPRDAAAAAEYERAQIAFHRSLARTPPAGFRGSAVFRVAALPWPWSAAAAQERAPRDRLGGYEDWYLLEDYTALGVLNEAAVGRGHRSPHDAVAGRMGAGTGGLYGLVEGQMAGSLGEQTSVVWVARPPGAVKRGLRELLADMLVDGATPGTASLWRRQFVLGPAPEYCLLHGGGEADEHGGADGDAVDGAAASAADSAVEDAERPAGVSLTRLPAGWSATTLTRQAIFA
ncbi:MAG TPA: hypothetical protein VL972_03880 [Solirubrobacteraceae bacterium]|nr:hypothetical protein [Solirubrobacteraceae bacterium]